jgi:hypothetical protein
MIKPDPDLMDSLLNFSDEEVKQKAREKCVRFPLLNNTSFEESLETADQIMTKLHFHAGRIRYVQYAFVYSVHICNVEVQVGG